MWPPTLSASYQHLPRLQVLPLISRNHLVLSGMFSSLSLSSLSPLLSPASLSPPHYVYVGPNGPVGPVAADESGSAYYSDIVAGRSVSMKVGEGEEREGEEKEGNRKVW